MEEYRKRLPFQDESGGEMQKKTEVSEPMEQGVYLFHIGDRVTERESKGERVGRER